MGRRARHIHFAKVCLCFTTGESTNGDTRRISLDHFNGALSPEFEIKSALNDAKQVLLLGVLVGNDAPIKPSDGAIRGFFDPGVIRRCGLDDVVQLHDDVGANRVLEGHGVFWSEQPGEAMSAEFVQMLQVRSLRVHWTAIMRTQESDAFFRDLC